MKSAFHFFCVLALWTGNSLQDQSRSMNDDTLQPYSGKHGSKHSNRQIRDIQSQLYGKLTYESWEAHSSNQILPIANTSNFVSDIKILLGSNVRVYGHHTIVRNPLKTFSVTEPVPLGCLNNSRSTVKETAKSRHCLVAQNGGFFNTSNGRCIGNVVSDGRYVMNAGGVQNANFGMTKSGRIITGYLSEDDVEMLGFIQLITGVVWLVRNGTSYVEESLQMETGDSQESGTLRTFADIPSARNAIGHDAKGRVVFVQIDGQSFVRGANLHQFSQFLINQMGLVNAINLDGGGSTTLILNGTLANYPADHCVDAPMWRCAREVSTALCVHEPDCDPPCVMGACQMGKCACDPNWVGDGCDILLCAHHNCSQHGNCYAEGCLCDPGWHGNDCNVPCSRGMFGMNCSQQCACGPHSSCDGISGECTCFPGYDGKTCEEECTVGRYGMGCQYNCHCSDTCLCHHVTGECVTNATIPSHFILNVSKCLVENFWKVPQQDDVDHNSNDLRLLAMLCITVACLICSIVFNILLLWRIRPPVLTNHKLVLPSSSQSSSSTYDEISDTSTLSSDVDTVSHRPPSKWNSLINKLLFRKHYVILDNEVEDIELDTIKS